jgi:hypothetical protein
MFTMMESLEGRQMFSVASPESTVLAVATDTSAPTQDSASPKVAPSSTKLYAACCSGKHIPTFVISG